MILDIAIKPLYNKVILEVGSVMRLYLSIHQKPN
jgi:hypothetical protein